MFSKAIPPLNNTDTMTLIREVMINGDEWKLLYKEKYGVENPRQRFEVIEKAKKTCLKKYGVEWPSQSKEIKDKTVATVNARYGGYASRIEKMVEYSNKHRKEIQKKKEQTCLERYGVKNYGATEEHKKKLQLKRLESTKKDYLTKKSHNSFNISNQEKRIYQLLLQKFPDTISQYRSDVYPFNCDFYIPSKDFYIEYQGSWT